MSESAPRKGWTRVAFGDVVRQVRNRVDPETSGLERYVAGEHMDSDDLRIRRWGLVGDGYLGPAFHMRFKPGQVLYGSRRTYLRKVALADFEGVTANTTFVLEPKDPEVLLPGLLPFLMQTEPFHEHSIKQSKGSVNPYVNFSDLTWFEFALPPLNEQLRIVSLLNAARELAESYRVLFDSSFDVARASESRLLVGGHVNTNLCRNIEDAQLPSGWRLVQAALICAAPVTSGITPRNGEVSPDANCLFIKVGNLMFDGRLEVEGLARLNRHEFNSTKALHVIPGDVLTNIVGPPLGKVSVVPASVPEALINQAIVRYRPPDSDLGLWLLAYLMSPWAKEWLFARSKKTSGQRNINATTCAALPVPVPPRDELGPLLARINFANAQTEAARIRAEGSAAFLSLAIARSVCP